MSRHGAARGRAAADRLAVRRSACARSASSSSPTARSARAARGSSSPMPTSPTRAGCNSIRDAEMLALADTAAAPASRSRPTRSATPPMRRSSRPTSSCRGNTAGDRRWRIEHFQIVDPADIPRLAPAGIIASMQPTHQTSDRLMAEKRLGPEPARRRLCLADGAQERRPARVRVRLPGGIAQSVPRPFRRDQPAGHERPAAGRLDSGGAADASSRRWPASPAARLMPALPRTKIGALEPGKWADFILVDRDPTAGRCAGAGANRGAGDLGRREEGVGARG